MGVLLRFAVSVAILLGVVYAAEYTADWPVDPEIRAWNVWINSLIVPQWVVDRFHLTHELTMYVRNLIAGTIQFQLGSGLWSLYLYVLRRDHFYPDSAKVCVPPRHPFPRPRTPRFRDETPWNCRIGLLPGPPGVSRAVW